MSKLTKYSAIVNLMMFMWMIMTFWEGYYGINGAISLIKFVVFTLIACSMTLGFLILILKGNAILLKIQAPLTAFCCLLWIGLIYVQLTSECGNFAEALLFIVDGLGKMGVTILLTVLVYTGKLFMKETDKAEMPKASLAFALVPVGILFLVNSLSLINIQTYFNMLQYGEIRYAMGMDFVPTVTFISAILLTVVAFNYCRIRSRKLSLVTSILAFVFAAGDIIFEFAFLLLPELL